MQDLQEALALILARAGIPDTEGQAGTQDPLTSISGEDE